MEVTPANDPITHSIEYILQTFAHLNFGDRTIRIRLSDVELCVPVVLQFASKPIKTFQYPQRCCAYGNNLSSTQVIVRSGSL